MAQSDVPKGAQAVDRALAILLEFKDGTPALGITELSSRLDLSPSTVHRLLQALVARGFLTQEEKNDRYRLGLEVLHLGRNAERHLELQEIRPLLKRLSAETQESVNLALRAPTGKDGVIVERVESQLPLRFSVQRGDRIPLHCSASGKCLLAFSRNPQAEVAALGALEGLTENSIRDPELLKVELERTVKRGYSIDNEEFFPGVRCVGYPIVDSRGFAVAAIAVQGPAIRLTPQRVDAILPQVSAVANEVSRWMQTGANDLGALIA